MAWFHYIAFRLSDGGSEDDTLYPTRIDAALHQLAPEHCQFLRITPDGMSPRAAWRYLLMSREIKGRHRNDLHRPEYEPILPQRRELARAVFL